jgi:cell wall-associated NlpC family hydrolase
VSREEEDAARQIIVDYARKQIGKKYRLGIEVALGADSSPEWDCSELYENAYYHAKLRIPDGSNYQFEHCLPIKAPLPGDLGFLWSDKWQRIGHVMGFIGDGRVIHAVGGRGVVEDDAKTWEGNSRWRGWRRHRAFKQEDNA